MSTGAPGNGSVPGITLDWASADVRRVLSRALDGEDVSVADAVLRAEEAWSLGATEVCIQAGLPPKLDGRYYIDLCRAIKRALPDLHLHAFSPEEILYGSVRSGLPIKEYLTELNAAGLGTLPGTSA